MMSGTAATITTSSQVRASLRATVGAVLACATASFPVAASAVPVIPQAAGFGIDTPAGRGGAVMRVTNLNDSGAGSLRACVEATGPRVCVFEVSGVIRMKSDLKIRNSNITIAGQTAPSPGVMLLGAGLHVLGASDVLVQHLRVRPGDNPDGPDPDNRDALKLSAPTSFRNVVIDHCSFSWSIDEVASLFSNWDNVTLTNNIFANPLDDSLHSKGRHGYGVLLEHEGRASVVGNLFANNARRSPLSKASHVVLANNVVYNAVDGVMQLTISEGYTYKVMNSVVGNVFLRGPDSGGSEMIEIRPAQAPVGGMPTGSKVYIADNAAQGGNGDPWSIVGVYESSSSPFQASTADVLKYRTNIPPVWAASLTRLPASDNVTLNHVLKNVGARPADRDSVDRAIVDGVKNGTGRFINCVASNGTARCERNAGGWPTLAANKRALTLPKDPNVVTASGYTNLELWLHKMSAEVEGRSPTPPMPPHLAGN